MKRFLLFVLLLVTVGCGAAPQPTPISIPLASTPRDVIVDGDMAVDDLIALLYLLARPDVNVTAITISGTGITRCDAGIRNVRAILEMMERTTIPIACGRETPLQGDHAFPSEWRDEAETFFGLNLKPSQIVTPNENAVALLTRTIESANAPVTILALGPLTNLADAFAQHPALTQKIGMLYSMGGAVNVSGNVDMEKTAEWNFYADPGAAAQVLASNVPITLVPLDATNHVPVTRGLMARFQNYKQTPPAKLAERLLQTRRGEIESGLYYLWDVLSAVIVTDSPIATFQEMPLVVETGTGQTKQDAQGKNMRVVTNVDAARFEATFLQTLNGQFK